jgi:hypothetical protein
MRNRSRVSAESASLGECGETSSRNAFLYNRRDHVHRFPGRGVGMTPLFDFDAGPTTSTPGRKRSRSAGGIGPRVGRRDR